MTVFQLIRTPNGLVGLQLPTLTGKRFVPLREIVRLEGQRNYTLFVLNSGRTILIAKTIGLFEASLPSTFVRVSRGCVINLAYLTTIKEGKFGLKDGFEIIVSRRRVKQLEALQQAA